MINECHVKVMFKLLYAFKLPNIYKVCMYAILPKWIKMAAIWILLNKKNP